MAAFVDDSDNLVARPTVHVHMNANGKVDLLLKRYGQTIEALRGNEKPFFVNNCIVRSAYSSDLLALLPKIGEEVLKHLFVRRTSDILTGLLREQQQHRTNGDAGAVLKTAQGAMDGVKSYFSSTVSENIID